MNENWKLRAPWREILAALETIGLNEVGVADPDPVAVANGMRSAVVLGSGGPALWTAFVTAIREAPSVLTDHGHPLDRFVARAIHDADPQPEQREWVRCAFDAERFVDFRPLARQAGFGWPSRLGLLLHPKHGPWQGLRAVCFTTERLPRTGPLEGDGPCAGCPAPCVSACPVGAVGGLEDFRIGLCAAQKESGGCTGHCPARQSCPEGVASRYPVLAQNYHDDRRTGRLRLARALRIETDARVGEGPYWSDWAMADPTE